MKQDETSLLNDSFLCKSCHHSCFYMIDMSLKVVLVVVTLTYCSLHFCKMSGHFDAIY